MRHMHGRPRQYQRSPSTTNYLLECQEVHKNLQLLEIKTDSRHQHVTETQEPLSILTGTLEVFHNCLTISYNLALQKTHVHIALIMVGHTC